MLSPCYAIEAGDTVGSLAKGYVTNTSCVFKYESRLESLRKYFEQQSKLYNKQ